MATYKLIQDIEAEDHILGPLTLRQFIYALAAIFFFYLCFITIAKHAPIMLIVLLPPGLLFGFFAFPFKRDQPTEVWALAKVRFLFKPRRRLWDQSGITQLVTITAPKKVKNHLTKELSESEVKGRLELLATTIDSRGWAIKNVSTADLAGSQIVMPDSSDRLIDISSIPRPVPEYTEQPGDDMLDELSSPLSEQFTKMIQTASDQHRQKLIDNLNDIGPPTPLDAIKASAVPTPTGTYTAFPYTPDINEQQLSYALRSRQAESSLSNARLHTISTSPVLAPSNLNPIQAPPIEAVKTPPTAIKRATDPAILNLAGNDDLSISAIANEARRVTGDEEVVIELH